MNDELTEIEKEEIIKIIDSTKSKLNDKEFTYVWNLAYWLGKEFKANEEAVQFIDRYLNLNLEAFDTKSLLIKLKEILTRERND